MLAGRESHQLTIGLWSCPLSPGREFVLLVMGRTAINEIINDWTAVHVPTHVGDGQGHDPVANALLRIHARDPCTRATNGVD
jgi:hypothetical protein